MQPRLETRPIVLNWRVSGHFSRHYVCIGHDNACSKLCHIYRAEASPPPVAQRFQITKIRQKVHKPFFWNWMVTLTYAAKNLTIFKYSAHAITGNRYYANLLKSIWKKFVKWHQVNLFLVGFSHLESLCVAVLSQALDASRVNDSDRRHTRWSISSWFFCT